MKNLSVLGVFLFFISACNQSSIDYDKVRNDKNIVIKSFSSLPTIDIKDKKPIVLNLGKEHKDVIILDGIRTFASKLSIPFTQNRFSVKIAASAQSGFFSPKILFLDENYKIIKTSEASELFFDRGVFKGTIFVNKNYKKIQYIIVTEDLKYKNRKETLNYVTATTIPVTTGMYTFYYTASSGDLNRTIESSSGGHIELMLDIYKASILGEEEK